jgi:cell division protein FtsL
MNKKVLWNSLSSLLIVAMFLLQYSPELEKFKYWICFAIVVVACAIIIYNSFALNYKLTQANKQITRSNKRITELESQTTNNTTEIAQN